MVFHNTSASKHRSCTSRRYYDCEDRPRRNLARIFSILTIFAGCGYLVWTWFAINRAHPAAGALFYAAELSCLLLFVIATVNLWRLRFKPPVGLAPEKHPSVDVFIPTYDEPLHILETTVAAASAIRWQGKLRLYVLDDSGRKEVAELASRHGMEYLSRPRSGVPRDNAKAGNLNFGLQRSSGEFFLVLDADQVPTPNILESVAGYMRFGKVAFIQTKQSYLTPEGDPFYNQSKVFYDVVQLALDNKDTVISCGNGVLYRRAALESIGGFVTWNIVEDLTTSYELHARGWQSFYFPYALTKGLSPSSIWGVYQQRGQWALDTMRLFFWDNPLFKTGLRLRSRLSYLTVAFSYLCAAFIYPFFFCIPVWTYLTGDTVLMRWEVEFVLVRSVYFLCMALALRYLCYGGKPGKQFRMMAGLFPVYMSGILRALRYPRGKKPGYCPNNATSVCSLRRKMPEFVAVLPQLSLLLLNATLPLYALLAETAEPRVIMANAFISALAIWAMSTIVLAALAPVSFSPDEDPEVFYAAASS